MAGAAVPVIFDQPGAAFVLLRPGIKFPPVEKEWEKNGHSFQEAAAHAAKGGNVGAMAGNGHIGLDQDEPGAFKGLELPATTTWETRPGRLGMRFTCKDRSPEVLAKYGKKADQAQIKLFKEGKPVGEVKLERTYQVIPPSWKEIDGQRVDYRMLGEIPPAEISLAKLLEDLQAIGITFSSKQESNTEKLEEIVKKSRQRRAESDEQRTRKYAEAALRDEVLALVDASEGNRNEQLNKSAFALGQFVSARVLDESEVVRELTRAARATGLSPDEIERTIRSGLESGARHPREIPEKPKSVGNATIPSRGEQADPKVEKIAKNIMERGDILKFLAQQAQKNHIGDTDVIKHLFASVACTNSLTSAGIQPELNGEKGHGKTDAVKAVFHCVPNRWKLAGSISTKALFYYKGLPAGSIIFSDDVEWSQDLIATVKRSMGNFQEPQTHFTLDKNRNPLAQVMPERLAWWLSSVESVADDQLKDRQYSLDIDEDSDHTREVSDFLRCARSQKKIRFSVDWHVEVAREIIAQIKGHDPFKVVIDCAEAADWKVKEDHRTQNKFWDLVEAFAILRYKQRYIDGDGWLHATVEDFNEAKAIFMRRKANHRTHLTNAQTKIIKSVIALQNEADGATQARIAEDLAISQQAVSKGLKAIEANTRFIVHYPGIHNETFYKCTVAALEVIYGEGDIVTLPSDYKDPFNQVQPPYNQDTTNLTTNKINNNNNKHTTIQPNIQEHSNGSSEDGKVEVNSQDCYTQENGCKVVKSSPDIDYVGSKEVVVSCKCPPDIDIRAICFLGPCPKFVGLDGKEYGPFQKDDVISLPQVQAIGLDKKGVARLIPKTDNDECSKPVDSKEKVREGLEEPAELDSSEKIRIAARIEYGYNGSVDPAKVASSLKLPVDEVTAWLEANYTRLDRPDGVIRYTQRGAVA